MSVFSTGLVNRVSKKKKKKKNEARGTENGNEEVRLSPIADDIICI